MLKMGLPQHLAQGRSTERPSWKALFPHPYPLTPLWASVCARATIRRVAQPTQSVNWKILQLNWMTCKQYN